MSSCIWAATLARVICHQGVRVASAWPAHALTLLPPPAHSSQSSQGDPFYKISGSWSLGTQVTVFTGASPQVCSSPCGFSDTPGPLLRPLRPGIDTAFLTFQSSFSPLPLSTLTALRLPGPPSSYVFSKPSVPVCYTRP